MKVYVVDAGVESGGSEARWCGRLDFLDRNTVNSRCNAENKRGPKGANIALFCIPNAYYDEQVYELVKGFGNVVFCSVATHRETGASRGYALEVSGRKEIHQ